MRVHAVGEEVVGVCVECGGGERAAVHGRAEVLRKVRDGCAPFALANPSGNHPHCLPLVHATDRRPSLFNNYNQLAALAFLGMSEHAPRPRFEFGTSEG